MTMQNDNRSESGKSDIDPRLVDEALQQLDSEIALFEEWLAELEQRPDPDEATRQAAMTYRDKLRSRCEMRDALLISRNINPRKEK